ncbi:MAG: TonB-dependent receptor, partial [Deltaproteobacteria bacterium]|nr:TonB-dependent receptor [Deltaproteobacteria bacterium]
KNERGDIERTFFSDDLLPDLHQEEETSSFRFGFHHSFVPGSDLIGNFQYSDGEYPLHDEEPDPEFIFPIFHFDIENNTEAAGGELSYLFKSEYVNFVTGGGYFDIDDQDQISFALDFGVPPLAPLDQLSNDMNTTHSNFYFYSYIKPWDNLTFTVGGSGDFFETDDELVKDQDQFNPKVGVSLDLDTGTTLRGAAFRVLKRTLVTDQTLEPTQVAGFNQFFDEPDATDYWRYGGAIDQKFSDSIYGGIEYSYRDLIIPYVDFGGGFFPLQAESDWQESLLRAYLFWTPCTLVSLTAEYRHEDLKRDKGWASGTSDSRTHFLPLGINLFHPSGLTVSLKGTYINQEGKFESKNDRHFFTGEEDDFWLVDAALSYRLPKRYGFITVGISNLFDEKFDFFDSDWENPQVQSERYFFAKITLALP